MIPPGQVGEIKTTLDTSALSGLIGKGISITTNDPYTPDIQLVVRARVVGSVLMLPGYTGFLSNRQIETRSTPFLIRQEPGEVGKLLISAPRASVPWIDVEVRELTEKHLSDKGLPAGWPGDWLLVATLKRGAPIGHFQETVRFNTGLQREPEVTLKIGVDLRPPVNLNSGEVSLVVGQPLTVLASLRRDLDPKTVVKLSAPAGLSARAEPGRGRFFKIHLEWNGPLPDAPVELRMEIAGETQTTPIRVVAADQQSGC